MANLPEALAQLAESGASFTFLAQPLTATLALCAQCIAFSFIAGTATGWWSWVDRMWSIAPALYVALYAALWPVAHPRLILMAVLSALWAVRLTYNFARKGGFGEVTPEMEDYRWPWVRKWMQAHLPAPLAPVLQHAFHALFVCTYQNVLLWLQVVPACMAVGSAPPSALTQWDGAAALAFLGLLALETVADETQWDFQSKKHAMTPAQRRAAGGDFARGFCTSGIFAYSRHANFFAEQSMWWAFFAFGVAARMPPTLAAALLHYSAIGPLLLSLLFQGSTPLTEAITASKYPAYSAYQARVSCLIPWFPAGEGAAAAAAAAAAAPSAPADKAQKARSTSAKRA